MKRLSAILVVACACVLCASSLSAREMAKPGFRVTRESSREALSEFIDPGLRDLYESAAVDTYCLVWYNFEQMNWQGWTRFDNTAQRGTFWHVDDFAGLGGGSFGGLVPLGGTKSMWCGARANPSDPYMCTWMRAPGYGNGWSQDLGTAAFSFAGSITLSYKCHYDSEPDCDFTRVQYDAGNGDWQTVEEYTGAADTTATMVLVLAQARTKIRFHFTADGAWSDQDGLWNTDGGSIVDSICVRDNGALNNFQDFESATVGATSAGIWIGTPAEGYGLHSKLKNNLSDPDPCNDNFATQIVFFEPPWIQPPFESYTPFCLGSGGISAPCQDELVLSPLIDMTKYSTACNATQNGTIPVGDLPLLGGAILRFTVYRDLPLANLVFYRWKVREVVDGCPGQWRTHESYYYGADQSYIFSAHDISDLVGGNNPIQIALGVVDMCDLWYLSVGNCAAHTPAPWFDNVRLYRYKTSGPQWSYRDVDLFQDNFPTEEYNIESVVRADEANDINANDDPVIRPGDSIVVACSSLLGGGIAADPMFGGPAVYIHVKCIYLGPAPVKPNLYGPTLAGSTVNSSFNYVSDDGVWTIIQCDTARTDAGIVVNRYCVDLNDELFTRGYEIEYYFTARDLAGVETALPKWCRSYGPYFEFTCLPTKKSNVLFVDDCTGSGSFLGAAENYWVPTFYASIAAPDNDVDIYDVNGPSSGVSNGPGGRAKNRHLIDQYYGIVWDSGDLESMTISDGTVNSDKSNDCQMLIDWMDLSEHRCGLWICGGGVAYDLDNLSTTPSLSLTSTWCGVDFVHNSYFDVTGGRTGGGVVNPLITGDADAGIFVHTGVPDKFYAFGGCPIINRFDVLGKTANGLYALRYPVYNSTNYYGGIASEVLNGAGFAVRTMWFGFSYQYIRDDALAWPEDRFEIARDVFAWMQFGVPWAGSDEMEAPLAYKLAQNFPNPFNPVTTIRFDMKEKGFVTVKIYNVAGELVRTLVDGVRDAGAYSIQWDGKNASGVNAASGIYFYQMAAGGFTATKKTVLLR